MKPCSRIWAKSVRSGFQKPLADEQQDRLRVPAELRPGHLLDQFLQGADSARQRDEGVRRSNIRRLRVCMSETTMVSWTSSSMLLARFQEVRDDARDIAAMVEDGAGDRPHQADIAAAIDEVDARARPSRGPMPPHFRRKRDRRRIRSRNRRKWILIADIGFLVRYGRILG